MSRGVLTLLFLLIAAAPAFADEPPSGRLTELTGNLDVPSKTDDAFVLRIFTGWGHGVAEILAERLLERGPIRVKFPVPDREYVAAVFSRHHQPVIRVFRARQRQPRFKKPIRPRGWKKVAVTVTDAAGQRVADDVVTSRFQPTALLAFPRLPWLESEFPTPSYAICRVPWGDDGRLTVSMDDAWEQVRVIRRSVQPIRLVRRPASRPLFIRAKLWPAEKGRGDRPDPTHLTVEYLVDGAWRPAPPRVSPDSGVPTIEGWTAVRISYPRHRPFVRLRGDRPDVTHVECRLDAEEHVRMTGSSLQVVPHGLGPPDPAFAMCGTAVGWGGASPFRMELLDADGKRCDGKLLNPRFGRGLPAGVYTLKVRGRLGRPGIRTLNIPAKCAVRVPVDVVGGSGIRFLARGDGGRLAKTVSFRVADTSGRAVEVEYTDAARRGFPEFAFEDRRFKNVPNAGLIRLDPGEWRIELLDGETVTETHDVHAWPNTVSRLDMRVRRAVRGASPKQGVRLR